MVARGNDDIGLWILGLDTPTDVGNARRRIAAAGFLKNVAARNVGQLLGHYIGIPLIGHYPNILNGADALESVNRHLYQRAADT